MFLSKSGNIHGWREENFIGKLECILCKAGVTTRQIVIYSKIFFVLFIMHYVQRNQEVIALSKKMCY